MAPPSLVTQYARCMADCLAGHPLYDLEPHDAHDAFLVDGTQTFDVAWIDSGGNLKYGFSAGLGPNDARNLDNTNVSLVPPGHEQYTGCRPQLDFHSERKYGQYFVTRNVESMSIAAAPGISTASSFSFSDQAAAVLFVPDDHTVWFDRRPTLSCNYARKHTAAWYRFLNGSGNHAVRNGELYFVTSCRKTKEWHNLCVDSSKSARDITVRFDPNLEADVGFVGSFVCESSEIQPQKGPAQGPPERETQCASVQGWKLALCSRFIRFAKVPVRVNKAEESTFWSKFFGKSKWVPYQSSISKSESPASSNNNSSTKGTQATDTKESFPTLATDSNHNDPQVKFERDKIVTRAGNTCWIDTGKQLGIDGEPPSTHALTEVFPYIEESAPWMDVVIAHDKHYLSVLRKGECVPDAKELAARLMQDFVIDVDEDMNGMLVNREEAHLTKDDLAFVVHEARRYTVGTLGFDVIRKNIPAGWILAAPRFGRGGVQSPVQSTPVTGVAVSHGACAVSESPRPDKSFAISINNEQDDEDDYILSPPPPYALFNGDSPYIELKAGLARTLMSFKGAKTIHSAPQWDQHLKYDYGSEGDGLTNSLGLPLSKFHARLVIARRRFIQGKPLPEGVEVMAVEKLFTVLENRGCPQQLL